MLFVVVGRTLTVEKVCKKKVKQINPKINISQKWTSVLS